MSPKIKEIKAREILDSRGNPTIEVEMFAGNKISRAAVPSGASTGVHEALELRDKTKRYNGKGVKKAIKNVSKIATKLKGESCLNQSKIDNLMIEMDGTKNKSNLGANAILAVSLANARLAAKSKKLSLYQFLGGHEVMPTPFMNVINGGEHAGNKLAIQEFMIAPQSSSFKEALRMGAETYQELKSILKKKHGMDSTNVGDEGGFAPDLNKVEDALKLLMQAIKNAGYEGRIKLAIDAAASEFYNKGKYKIDGRSITPNKLAEKYSDLIKKYPIISLEDPFSEDDFDAFSDFTKKMGDKIQIVGDDLLVTQKERIEKALQQNACNSLLLKVNQVGTVTEAMESARIAMNNKWNVMVSHRSGETEDPFIADLTVGLGTGQIKSGAPCRSERLAKYNQLLRIEEQINEKK